MIPNALWRFFSFLASCARRSCIALDSSPPGWRSFLGGVALLLVALASPAASGQSNVDLGTWLQQGVTAGANWQVQADGLAVFQTVNTASSTFFVSTAEFIDTTIRGRFGVQTTSDDDMIGILFGYKGPIASAGHDPKYNEFILLDWKQLAQSSAPTGFRLAKVKGTQSTGTGTSSQFWAHTSSASCTFTKLANPLVNGGWADNVMYDFELVYQPTRIIIKIKGGTGAFAAGVTVYDVHISSLPAGTFPGDVFPSGLFGFYNLSQENVRYESFTQEGVPILLTAPSSGGTLAFGNVRLGDSGVQTLGISNVGGIGSNLNGTAANPPAPFGGPLPSADFLVVQGQSAERLFTFTPVDRTLKSQVVAITSDGGTSTVTLTGRGVGPTYQSSPAPGGVLNAGAVGGSGVGTASLVLSNTTADAVSTAALVGLTVVGWSIDGPDSDQFALSGLTPGQVIAKGGQATATIAYTPDGTLGSPMATLTIVTDQGAPFGTQGSQYVYDLVDASGPTATVAIAPASPVGPGTVEVAFTISEPVQIGGGSPAFAYKPSSGVTKPLALVPDAGNPRIFRGSFTVDASTTNGQAEFTWSGVDMAGNAGSSITSGRYFTVDKIAPTGSLVLNPSAPLKAETVALTLTSSESLPQAPALVFVPAGATVGTGQPLALSGGPTVWTSSLAITGATPEGWAQFAYSATDAAGNVGTVLTAGATAFVDRTAPGAPSLFATKHPAGYFQLSWTVPVDASSLTYRVYRGSSPFALPGQATQVQQVSTASTADQPPVEGTWYYGVVAVDASGNESPLSNVVQVESDPPPPEDVTHLTVVSATSTALSVSWTPSANTAGLLDGYRVYRNGALLGALPESATSYTFSGLQAGSAYTLEVTAFDTNNRESLGTSIASHTLVANPTGVVASPQDQGAQLSWSPSAGAALAHYAIYVSGASFSDVSALSPAKTVAKPATQTLLSGLANGTQVWVAVVAVNASGFFSPIVTSVGVTPVDVAPPEPPTALAVSSSGATSIDVGWLASPNSAGDLAGYRVRRDGAVVATLPAGTTTAALVGLTPASAFSIAVTAFDAAGNESSPATKVVHTWLEHPAPVSIAAHDRSLAVSWIASQPPQFAAKYLVYTSTSPFSDVSAMTPSVVASGAATAATVGNLVNGVTYYVAVAVENLSGGMNPAVASVTGVPADDAPPANPTDLAVASSTATSVDVSWAGSANPAGDLAGYRVYLDGAQVAESGAGTGMYSFSGLSAASAYTAKVSAFDTAGNESSGTSLLVYTWLPHPTGVVIAEQSHGTLKVAWNPVVPAAHLHSYRVYASTAPFTSTAGLSPTASVAATSTSRTLSGLVNGTTYYVAVSAVSKSAGEDPAVAPISGAPVADTQPPALGNLRYGGQALPVGGAVGADGSFAVDATDAAGVAFVRFLVDGVLLGVDASASGGWTASFSPELAGEGPKILTVEAQDALGNLGSITHEFLVVLAPPAAPTIVSPTNGAAVNTAQILVKGTGKAGTTARVYVNGVLSPGTALVDGAGKFSVLVSLAPGPNQLRATVANSGGESALGPQVSVVYDDTQLAPPKGLGAAAFEGGVVKLTWFAVVDTSSSGLAGYRVYRAAAPFTSPAEATLLTVGSVSKNTGSSDLPPEDATWYYAVVAETNAGTQSELSALASVTSDATPPRATSIAFEPQGAYEPISGRVGQGPLSVTVTVNEPLLTDPFLSLAISNAQPIAVGLGPKAGSHGLVYSGIVQVTAATPSGLATAVLSARDQAGNRGTAIDGPMVVLLDTDAPNVVALTIEPQHPIKNASEAPTVVQVHAELDGELPEAVVPELTYALSSTLPTPQPIALAQVGPTAWTGGFMLPSAAGAVPEALQLAYHAVDDLGNVSTSIAGKSSFEVYQGQLPALVAPLSLSAVAKPAGAIAVSWPAVAGADEYQLYRKGPGDSAFLPLARVNQANYTDVTPIDGTYQYVVSSIRVANGEESESASSPLAQAASDSVPPNSPQNLEIALASNGIALTWAPPIPYTEPMTYRLYRASGLEIPSLEGLEPLVAGLTATLVVDPTPSQTEHAYAVAAADSVGNVSAPSNSAYLNPGLLPVASLHIVHNRAAAAAPLVSWTHPSANLAGYVVSVDGVDATAVSPATAYVDALYASGARTYGIRAVDLAAQESLERTLRLVPATVSLAPDAAVVRGQIAAVDFDVTSAEAMDGATLRVHLQGKDHVSAPFAVAAGGAARVPVVLGGDVSLPATPTATVTTRREPHAGERVDIVDALSLPIRSDAYVAQVIDLDLERGAVGSARFSFTNTGNVPVELVMAKANGASSSDQIRFTLLDADGNVLSTAGVKQATSGVLALPNGTSVARVLPGDTFSSLPMALAVPAGAPDFVTVKLTIDQVHYDLSKPTHVAIAGLSTTAAGSLVEPPYAATVTHVTPALSWGADAITITGEAIETETGVPAGDVPVTLVIRLDGFVRTYNLYTNQNGQFDYTFVPSPNEGGVYDVWAKYPELLTQPVQSTFTIQRVVWSPKSPSVALATGYEMNLEIAVATGKGTPVTSLRLAPGTLPTGLSVVPAPGKTLLGNSTSTVSAALLATSEAPTSGSIQLELVSDERLWGVLLVNYVRTTPMAALVAKPTFIETGAVRGGLQMEEVLLTNKGLASAQNVTVSLLNSAKTAPAPAWASVASSAFLGTLAPGASVPVSLAFAPTDVTVLSATSPYSFVLRVSSPAKTLLDMPVYAWVSQSGQGGALFHVIDMYTGTANAQGQTVLGVAGAKVKLDRLLGAPYSVTKTADGGGEVLFLDVPAGSYRWRVSANGHDALEGNVVIKPGVTSSEEVFLPIPYITIEWDVTEITIEDKYEILLSATFETDVPAPVVVIEPPSISLPPMAPGDVFLGELKLSNYGLVKTQSTTFKLPSGGSDYKFELLSEIPTELDAKSTVVVPYRVVKLDNVAQGGGSSGGGCGVSAYWGGVSYGWVCLAGTWVWGAFPVVFLIADTSTCPTGTPKQLAVPSPKTSPVSCSSCGGWTTPSWKPKPSDDKPCDPCDHPSLTPLEKECCQTGKKQPTKSEVDLVTGDYSDDIEDLPVQILGWRVPFERSYRQGIWSFELMDTALELVELQGKVSEIRTTEALFSAADESATVFEAGDGLQIFAIDDGPRKWRLDTRSKTRFYFDSEGKLLAIRNRQGHSLTIDRDGQGRIAALRDSFDAVFAAYSYTAQGQVSAIDSVLDGRRVEYTWTNGRLTKVRDPAGLFTHYAYDSAGRIIEKRLPNGQVNRIEYSATGMVVSVLDEEGNGTFFDYGFNENTQQFYSGAIFTDGRLVERWFDKQGTLLKTLVDGAEQGVLTSGATTLVDSAGKIVGVKAADGTPLAANTYDGAGRLTRETDARGVVTDYTYDAKGNVLSETQRRSLSGPVLAARTFSYDEWGRKVSETVSGLGETTDQTTSFEYDAFGNVVREVSPAGVEVLRTYDHRGALTSEADGEGNEETWQYDAIGRLVERRMTSGFDASTIVESWSYEPELAESGVIAGTRVTYTDPDGRQMVERWDVNDRPYEVVDPWGRVTRLSYDSQGDLVKVVSAEGQVTELAREVLPSGLRRLTREVDGVVVLVEDRDAYDRLVRREVEGEEAHYFYDGAMPLPKEVVQPGGRTLYEYDYFGNQVSERRILDDGTEVLETRTFEGLRETSHTNGLGNTLSSEFGAKGTPIATVLPSGRTIAIEVDDLGRPLSYPSVSGDSALTMSYGSGYEISRRTLPNGAWQDYTFDDAGNVVGIETSWGPTVDSTLDRRGNPVEKRWFAQPTDESPVEVATYEYESTGLRTLSSNSTVTIETTRDPLARATSTTYDFGPFAKTFTQIHDSSGRTTGLVMPDGTAYGYEYDPFGRVSAVVLPDGDAVALDYPGTRSQQRAYPNGVIWGQTNDMAFNPVSVEALRADGEILMDWQYHLDAHRVASIETEAGTFGFSYDADEQLVGATYPTLPPDVFAYDLDGNRTASAATAAASWTHSASDELLDAGSLGTFTWLPSGSMAGRDIGGAVQTFEYDYAERLHRVLDGAGQVVAEYEYDADGFRVVKKVGTTTTYAIYGEQGLLAEYDATGAELRRYVWLPGEAWQSGLVAFETDGARYFPLLDAQGEVRTLTDSSGQVAWHAEIRAFGDAVVFPGAAVSFALRPSGQVFDAETGLHYNTARYYDPALGRYISLDPLLELGGDRNLYAFAYNNPIAYEDRLGLAVGTGKASWECVAELSALDFKDPSCSGELSFKVNPWVSLKVKLSIKPNKQDCCKDGKKIVKGKGCIEVKISGSADVGFDPLSYIPSRFHKYLAPAGAKDPFKIQVVKATISGSCNFCNKCGESGYGGSDVTCCLDLEVEGPSFSANLGWFKVSVKVGKVTVGKVCYGPYGWDFSGPSLTGPSWGGGPARKKR